MHKLSLLLTLLLWPIVSFGAATATFVKTDTTTQGSWHGVYGADGYSIANDSQSLPSYATFSEVNGATFTWVSPTTDVRALQNGANTARIASTWYHPASFYFDVNISDGKSHQIALYALDWDNVGRSETIQILDANTQAVLDTRTISSFTNGIYLIWNISGHVKVNVIWLTGNNAVISGVFFGATQPSVTLAWAWPATYNVYRANGTCPQSSYTKVASGITGNYPDSWTDTNVVSGQTYCYYATALDQNNNESTKSNLAQATIP